MNETSVTNHLQDILRERLLLAAIDAEDTQILDKALVYFKKWKENNESIPSHFQKIALIAGIRYYGVTALRCKNFGDIPIDGKYKKIHKHYMLGSNKMSPIG